MFDKILKPEIFQGKLNLKNYFEGWYYKYLSEDTKTSLVFIPGISTNLSDPHAFIQVYITSDSKTNTYYIRYPLKSFVHSKNEMIISIGKSVFKVDSLFVDINTNELDIQVHLKHYNLTRIKRNFLSPNIMGPFAFVPFMETKHGVISMLHEVSGSAILNKKVVSFNNSKGYLEKDWGKSFPSSYLWLQANYFNDVKSSFFCSYAKIPFLGFSFKGFICLLNYNQKEYRFATYNFSSFKILNYSQKAVELKIKKGKLTLLVRSSSSEFSKLPSPKNGMMSQKIKETLKGRLELELYKGKKMIYSDRSENAGMELMLRNFS